MNLKNVIVFSKEGPRPDCNEMSCGDLDGDRYFATWNENLVQRVQKVNDPAPL